jgi:hypothetical protein
MPFTKSQLDTWSRPGAGTGSKNTYAAVRDALSDASSPYASQNFRIFLQGSYGNDTNIWSESDVDVVICNEEIYYRDLDDLTAPEQREYLATHSPSSFKYADWTRDVTAQLRNHFGSAVTAGTKAVKIAANGSRRSADVLIAAQYRRYLEYQPAHGIERYEQGICFFTSSGERVANFPRQHSTNATRKHQSTSSCYKPMVRIWKNIRRRLVSDGFLAPGVAPSYYIEGLLYNVPDWAFVGPDLDGAFRSVFNEVANANRRTYRCTNELYTLLDGPPHVTWNSGSCDEYLEAVRDYWDRA